MTSFPVKIFAVDSSDSVGRNWQLQIYKNGALLSTTTQVHVSGQTMSFDAGTLPTGYTYLFKLSISQTGGSGDGTYAGTLTLDGKAFQFAGLNGGNSFSYPISM
jgi:hypothetical protein